MEDRKKIIEMKIKEEEFGEMLQLQGVKQLVWNILTKDKGFRPKEIEISPEFKIQLSNCDAVVSVDFIINLPQASFMVIRSVPTAIESWEKYVVAFARAVKEYQIPYVAVTDGENAKVFDAITGSIIRDGLNGLFSRQEAVELMKDFKKIPCPEKRLEKEKRIIYAFEGIKCPTPKPEASLKDSPEDR
jgi:hypothetical protein